MAESTDFLRSRYSMEKNRFLDESTDFFVLSPATIPIAYCPASLRHGDATTRDAQSTEKSVFYGFLSLVSVYGQKNYFWTNLRIFSY